MLAVALGAARRYRALVAAVVALEPLACVRNAGLIQRWLMVRERDRAVLALELFSAGAADHGKRIASPVEQDQRLFAAIQGRACLLHKGAGKELLLPGLLKLTSHVDEFYLGKRSVHDPILHGDARVLCLAAAFCQLSSDGVAEPRTTTAPASLARITATSRAL